MIHASYLCNESAAPEHRGKEHEQVRSQGVFVHDGILQNQGRRLCRKVRGLTTPASLGILGAARLSNAVQWLFWR